MLDDIHESNREERGVIVLPLGNLVGVEQEVRITIEALTKIEEGVKALRSRHIPFKEQPAIPKVTVNPEPRKKRLKWGPILDALPNQFTMKDVRRISGASAANATTHCRMWVDAKNGKQPKAYRTGHGKYVKAPVH